MKRLYYLDSAQREFDATVVRCHTREGRVCVVLDETAFYPTSGGQPFDTGTLDATRVVDVFEDESGDVAHVVEAPIETGTRVRGAIDWPRRLDHMQQHTGQHILSAAFDRLHRVRTESFHMGVETSTIDLARDVSAAEIDAAEQEANRVVWEDRPVQVRFATAEEASRLPLRKEPAREGVLRLVDVTDFDLSACGGTHVARTGTVGVVAVAGWERYKGATRLSFVCGGRALRAHRTLRDVVAAAMRAVSVTPAELPAAVSRLQEQAKATARLVRGLQEEVAVHRAKTLRASAETIGGLSAVLREEPEWDAPGLKALAIGIVSEQVDLAVLIGAGSPVPLVVARSTGCGVDAAGLLRAVVDALGGRGGGRPELAQGGVPASADRCLAEVRGILSQENHTGRGNRPA